MIEEGALTLPVPVDAAVGLHVRNDQPVGTIGVRPGPVMAAVDSMDITLSGRGGHGGAPHQTRDLIVVAAHLITALQTIRSRRIDPQDPAVVTIGAIHGGTANNVLPDRVTLAGTIRSFDARIRAQLEEEIRSIVGGVASTFGVTAKVDYHNGYPVTQNDPAFTALVQEAAATVLKESQVLTPRALMGAEDMSYYLERVPGCFFFLGTRNPDRGCEAPHHSSQFDLDEDAMQIGVQVFERVVSRYLERSR
jgi:amidohydrolase